MLGRGRYRLYRGGEVTDQFGAAVLALNSWIVRGVYDSPIGKLASMALVAKDASPSQLRAAKRRCRSAALVCLDRDGYGY